MNRSVYPTIIKRFRMVTALAFALAIVLGSAVTTLAQHPASVQEVEGTIASPDEAKGYLLENLTEGRDLYVYVEATSGNLDPFIALLPSDYQPGTLGAEFSAEVDQAIAENRDPLLVVADFSDRNFLAWDDDNGSGFSAAFEYAIPADGDYLLTVISSPFNESFGNYRMLVGLDEPGVLSGSARPAGEPFAKPATALDRQGTAVEEVSASLTQENPSRIHRLLPFQPGESLYVHVETISGDLIPEVTLRAYATKLVRSANIGGEKKETVLEYTFPAEASDYQLEISARSGTSGDYRLLVGRNVPEVLTGQPSPTDETLLQKPIEVEVGIKLQQIANIDQKSENYSAVATLTMLWNDPALAFRVDECQCEFQTYTAKDFIDFTTKEEVRWPAFTYLNQQNNRWIQNDYVVVQPDGEAFYFERFTTNFQAPDFDFRRFPFDTQQFFIRVQSLYGSSYFQFAPSKLNEVGTQLGEEEWYVTDFETEVVEETSSIGNETSNFIFRFFARRHLSFYIFRIFVPLILIITVSWITFFLEDYGKRVDATTANLLLFIAFNFTIANDLPRLGYMTYMDALLIGAFFISVLVVIYNVYLKRQEILNRETWLKRIDRFMIWLYPLVYFTAFSLITSYFFGT